MAILEKMLTFFMIYLLCYQTFVVHFRSKIIEGYMLVIPKFAPVFNKTFAPTAAPVNNFFPHTHISQDFDNNSVITAVS
jgi:hypothetical protein